MAPLIIVSYLFLCLTVAVLGRRSPLGFFRCMLLSAMLTPLPVVLYLLVASSAEERVRRS